MKHTIIKTAIAAAIIATSAASFADNAEEMYNLQQSNLPSWQRSNMSFDQLKELSKKTAATTNYTDEQIANAKNDEDLLFMLDTNSYNDEKRAQQAAAVAARKAEVTKKLEAYKAAAEDKKRAAAAKAGESYTEVIHTGEINYGGGLSRGKYVGELSTRNYPHGQGKRTWAMSNTTFEGTFDKGRKTEGTTTFSDGGSYTGTYYRVGYQLPVGNGENGENIPERVTGTGTFTYANGDTYVGQVVDNQRNGTGVWTKSNGDVGFSGEWVSNKSKGKNKAKKSRSLGGFFGGIAKRALTGRR